MSKDETGWLEGLSPGAEVFVATIGPRTTYRVSRVERLTKTQIVLPGGKRFWRKNGVFVGERSLWVSTRLVQPTPELRSAILHDQLAFRLGLMSTESWRALRLSTLKKIAALLPQKKE